MRRSAKITLAASACLAAAAATARIVVAPQPPETARIDALAPSGPGPLDGRSFAGMMGPEGGPRDVSDRFVFDGGTFVSKECETRCDYPARPYKATRTDGGWRFRSVTRCPHKDATIVWTGTVEGDTLTGEATWTIRRWYWTLERDFTFEARLQAQARTAGTARRP